MSRTAKDGRGEEEGLAKTSLGDETNGCWSALRCRDGYEDIEESDCRRVEVGGGERRGTVMCN